ncbi:hypothetical protein OB905_04795 [Halobacteria archaeon AArc-dxtr1]|nr:hypothetical protein [Halobacteria archaeon AArc-dxtr1]
MTALRGVPKSVYRAILIGILVYFVLLVVGLVGGVSPALGLADIVYGAIAVAIGGLLYTRGTGGRLLIASATTLILGGLSQFIWILTGSSTFDTLASMLVFLGLGGYLFAIAIEN